MTAVVASEPSLVDLEQRLQALEASRSNQLTIIAFSGELDRMLAAFTLATGAAASGVPVTVFFSFWATNLLRARRPGAGRPLLDRMLGCMLPAGPRQARLSRLDCFGLGRRLMARQMKAKGATALPELVDLAAECGVRIVVCETAMSMMGIEREDLIEYPNLDTCGVACFLEVSRGGRTLFI